MMATEIMYQQCLTQEEQNSNILGTMDEILATTTLMTPMILTIKTLSNGLVSIIAQFPKCSFVSRIVSVLCTCHVLPGCCIGPDGINIVAGALVETVGDTKTNKAWRHFCSKYTTRQIGGLFIDWTFFAALSMEPYPIILVCNWLVWLGEICSV